MYWFSISRSSRFFNFSKSRSRTAEGWVYAVFQQATGRGCRILAGPWHPAGAQPRGPSHFGASRGFARVVGAGVVGPEAVGGSLGEVAAGAGFAVQGF